MRVGRHTVLVLCGSLSYAGSLGALDQGVEARFESAVRADSAGNCERAVSLYADLAELDVPGALVNLGRMYMLGRCVNKDVERAESLFLRAARHDVPYAHANLATLYQEGLLGRPDYRRAYDHWSEAARLGVVFWDQLALMHYEGLGVPRNPEEAERLLRQGADSGDERAKHMLIEVYRDETGPLYSPEKAEAYEGR